MRDDKWLLSRLDHLWSNYFPDISQVNPVFIKFGRFARLRFGSIKLDRRSGKTYIVITGMFKNLKIPQEVVDHTIAHELSHYAHGFSSPHKQLHKYPHEGGVVNKEMKKRSLELLIKAYNKWIKQYREELRSYYSTGRRWR
ncbi:MAG: hypothetical protein V1808_00275 [Candidatus Daviesbacteria bacterium]